MNIWPFSKSKRKITDTSVNLTKVITHNQHGGQGVSSVIPSHQDIAKNAYFQYIGEGMLGNHDVEHWLEAESQLREGRHYSQEHGYYIAG